MKEVQIILTGAQSKEFRKTGKTIYSRGNIGYVVTANEEGLPVVTSLIPLESVNYEVVLRK